MCPYPPVILATQAGAQLRVNSGYRRIHGYLLCWLYVSQSTGDSDAWISYCYTGCADATTIIACLAGCIPTFL